MTKSVNLPDHVAAENPQTIQKAQISKGGPIAALVPESLDDVYRVSKALAGAGNMVPLDFQGKPDMIMAAILRGMEIGLAPMQALSNIAVINGRASLWGDALPAIIQKHGHHIDVVLEGEGDSMIAIATLTRGDTGRDVVRTFSVDDAKKANLWNKKGPWQQYPARMLSHRARAWAVRDGAADALMGLQVVEEVQDYAPMRDVTPKAETGFAQLAQNARAEAAKATQLHQDPPEAETPASEQENEPQGALELDPIPEGEALVEVYTAGRDAFHTGAAADENPHDAETPQALEWSRGWADAEGDIQ